MRRLLLDTPVVGLADGHELTVRGPAGRWRFTVTVTTFHRFMGKFTVYVPVGDVRWLEPTDTQVPVSVELDVPDGAAIVSWPESWQHRSHITVEEIR